MADYTLSAEITADSSKLTRELESASQKAKVFESSFSSAKLNKIGSALESVGGGIASVGKRLLPVTLGIGGVAGASLHASGNFIKLYESTMIVFDKMLGGKKVASDLYAELLNVAKASTFSQEAFLTSAKSLVGVGMGYDETLTSMQALTDAVSAFGGTSEDLERAAYAYRKIHTSGKVSMQDLNILMNAGVNGLAILANSYGVSTEEMRKMISTGAVPADEAIRRLNKGIEEGTDGLAGHTQALKGMSEQMKGKTLTGALDSMKSSFRNFALGLVGMNPTLQSTDKGFADNQKRIGQLTAVISTINQIIPLTTKVFSGLTDGIGWLLDKLVGANAEFNESTGKWEKVGGVLGRLKERLESMDDKKLKAIGNGFLAVGALAPVLILTGNVVGGLGKKIELVGSLMESSSVAGKALRFALSPIGMAVMAIGGAIAYLFVTNEKFRKATLEMMGAIWSAVKPVGVAVVELIKAIAPLLNEILQAVGSVMTDIITTVTPVIVKIAELIQVAVTFVIGLIESLKPIFSVVVGAMATIIERWGVRFSTTFAVIKTIATTVWGAIKTGLAVAWAVMRPIISAIGTVARWVFRSIKAVALPVWGAIRRGLEVVSEPIKAIFRGIRSVGRGAFNGIKYAVEGLRDVAMGVAQKIKDAFITAFKGVKKFINLIISGANKAISGLNKMPKVNIPKIEKLARGTHYWQGGFAVINERGGELVNLPSGSQVIPHDISAEYARESARLHANSRVDTNDIKNAMTDAVAQLIKPLSEAVKAGDTQIVIDHREFGRLVRSVK